MTQTLIIAEAGVNHNGEIEKAYALVDVAAEAGADYVKFQSFVAEKLVTEQAPRAAYQERNTGDEETQFEMLKRLELSYDDHLALIQYCHEKGIKFLSTAFDIDGLDMLIDDLGLDLIKLGSSELTNGPILLAAAHKNLPIIFSTGMGVMDDIAQALRVIAFGFYKPHEMPTAAGMEEAYNNPDIRAKIRQLVTILQCTTAYPTPDDEVNLRVMEAIREEFDISVGFSDHTMGTLASVCAVAHGATVIEKHFTLDRHLPGPDHKASLEPSELKGMIADIRRAELFLGTSVKQPGPEESTNINMARKSVVAANDIAAGEILSTENLTTKRPGTGLSPMAYWDCLGKPAPRAFRADELITLEEAS